MSVRCDRSTYYAGVVVLGWLATETDKVYRFEVLGIDRRVLPVRNYVEPYGPRYFDLKLPVAVDAQPAIRADLKEFRAETETRFAQINASFTEVNARVDGVASSIQALQKELGSSLQSLQRENATIRWMIGIGFTLLSLFFAISTFLRSGGS